MEAYGPELGMEKAEDGVMAMKATPLEPDVIEG